MRSNRSPFQRRPAALSVENNGDEAKILLYDEIGFWGVTSKAFIEALDAVSARTIHLHINSPGGDVFDGLAISNAIRAHSSRVVTHVDGLAASIASVIALSGDFVRMADNAFLMVHNPYMIALGNASELRKGADLLDKIGESIIGEYTKRTKKPRDQVVTWMNEETWFSASDAKENGFIDRIDGESKDAPTDKFDLTMYEHAPAALLQTQESEPTVRELEQAVRDAGLSRSHAKQLVAAGLRAIRPRDADEEGEWIGPGEELLANLQRRS